MTVWLVRSGERSRHARRFADNNIIAIGWPGIRGLDDWAEMDADEILLCLQASGKIGTPAADLAEILQFRDEMTVGDLVVTPDATRREVLIGEITGRDTFREPSPALDYRHVRSVRWFGRWERDLLPTGMHNQTTWRRTIRRLDELADDWTALGQRLLAGEGRHPTAPSASRR